MNNISITNLTNQSSIISQYGDFIKIYEVFTYRTIIQKILFPILIVLGIPGSIFSLIIWTRPKLSHTSSIYLARLAATEIVLFLCLLMWHLKSIWKIDYLSYPVICELFPIIYFAMQYLSPFFTFAFTFERYLLICWPFTGETLISIPRAKRVSIALTIAAFLFSMIQGYFFKYNYEHKACLERDSIMVEGSWENKLLIYWNLIIESFVFGILPLAILFLNILVIKETKRVQNKKLTKDSDNNSSNSHSTSLTAMLLSVSFYFILSTLPLTVSQLLVLHFFWNGSENMSEKEVLKDITWTSHFLMINIRSAFECLALSHVAAKFFIYILTSKQFRKQFILLFNHKQNLSDSYSNLASTNKSCNMRSRRYHNKNGINDGLKQNEKLMDDQSDL